MPAPPPIGLSLLVFPFGQRQESVESRPGFDSVCSGHPTVLMSGFLRLLHVLQLRTWERHFENAFREK